MNFKHLLFQLYLNITHKQTVLYIFLILYTWKLYKLINYKPNVCKIANAPKIKLYEHFVTTDK